MVAGGFLSRTFFTYGYRNVIRAVTASLADCGSMDGYVWDVLTEREPELAARARIVRRSDLMGFPPIACLTASQGLAPTQALPAALASLPGDAAARAVLAMLHLDGFAAGDCVETWQRRLERPVYLPLGTTAHKQGCIAGENAIGGERGSVDKGS